MDIFIKSTQTAVAFLLFTTSNIRQYHIAQINVNSNLMITHEDNNYAHLQLPFCDIYIVFYRLN